MTWKAEQEHVWGRGMCPIMETQPGPGHREQGQGTAEQPVPPGVLGVMWALRMPGLWLCCCWCCTSLSPRNAVPKLAVLFVSGDTGSTCPFFARARFVWMLSHVEAPAGQDTAQETRLCTAASQTQEDLFALLEVPEGP